MSGSSLNPVNGGLPIEATTMKDFLTRPKVTCLLRQVTPGHVWPAAITSELPRGGGTFHFQKAL
jgi:hypothetical protein